MKKRLETLFQSLYGHISAKPLVLLFVMRSWQAIYMSVFHSGTIEHTKKQNPVFQSGENLSCIKTIIIH
jgi:hypothetical protein